MPGVVENGLFAKRTADIIIQATDSEIIILRKRIPKFISILYDSNYLLT